MTQNQHQTGSSRDEILMEFALSDQEPLNDRLALFISTYPQYAASIARLARELEAFDAAPETELTQSEASDQLLALQVAIQAVDATGAADPFEMLSPAQLKGLAAHLNANSIFVTRLKDRLIDTAGMSEGFISAIATFLSDSLENVRASLARPPQIAAGTAFKAKGKPTAVPKQSFEEALKASGLTQEQQDQLRKL